MKNSMIFLFCLIFTLLLAIYACGKDKAVILPVEIAMPAKDTMITTDTTATLPAISAKYLALGDSYTIGESVEDTERFPAQTAKLLGEQQINVSTPEYIAVTGWTTTDLLAAINLQNPAKDFDIVTLLIGVNDQYQHRDTNEYRTFFTELLNKSIDLAAGKKAHVFVLSIPDYSAAPFVDEADKASVSAQVDVFNAINKEVTLQNNITYIDITPATRQAVSDASLVANDGLHPSGKEYAVWANMLAPLIKKVLQ